MGFQIVYGYLGNVSSTFLSSAEINAHNPSCNHSDTLITTPSYIKLLLTTTALAM